MEYLFRNYPLYLGFLLNYLLHDSAMHRGMPHTEMQNNLTCFTLGTESAVPGVKRVGMEFVPAGYLKKKKKGRFICISVLLIQLTALVETSQAST